MPDAQPAIIMPQGRAAVFVVLGLLPGPAHVAAVRDICAGADALERAVGARAADAELACAIAFSARIWDQLYPTGRPGELHDFRELHAGTRHAPATPGDILLHIRGHRTDLCFELGKLLMAQLGPHTTPIDEVHGFRYFDDRDLIGFVDGTENPQGAERLEVIAVGPEDAEFAGGSYVMVQKYIHDLEAWRAQSVETQERIIGRAKLDDVELADDVKPTAAHNALTTLDEGGVERKILRHNMPFGNVAGGPLGTYFIGYARSADILETMLENMVIGRPPGNYDRLLDFTRPITGNLFFAPSVELLRGLDTIASRPVPVAAGRSEAVSRYAGSLNIGTLKDVPQHE